MVTGTELVSLDIQSFIIKVYKTFTQQASVTTTNMTLTLVL